MNRNDLWKNWRALIYLLIGVLAFFTASYYYFYGTDMMKAIYWLIFSVGCEVSVIRINTE